MFPVPVRMQKLQSGWCRTLLASAAASLLVLALPAQDRREFVFRQLTPMGGDAVILMPARQKIQLMATLEAKELEGVRQIKYGDDVFLRGPNGESIRYYPRELRFRFSIGKKVVYIEKNPTPIMTSDTPDEFQSNLRFQLKVFRGLEAEVLEPSEAKIIGVPRNIPYDERIYSVRFQLPRQVPAYERMKLEVRDRNGNLVAKFQVQLL